MEQRKEKSLVKENLGLVGVIVARFEMDHQDRDDFFQIGCIGLCKAVETFDESKNIKFSTYAGQCIQNEILLELRKRNSKGRKAVNNAISFNAPINMHNDKDGLTIGDAIFDKRMNFEEKKEIEDLLIHVLKYIVNILNARERYIVLCRAGGINQETIAEKLGISQSFTSRLEKRATSSIENAVESDEDADGRYQVTLVESEIHLSFEGSKELIYKVLCKIDLNWQIRNFSIVYSEGKLQISIPADAEILPFIAEILEVVEE